MTIFLALTMLLFLTFCLVLIEGTRNYYLRVKAAQAMELTEFSVLSEYQQELFEHYGVFFLDLDYEQGLESISILEQRARTYLTVNAEETDTTMITAGGFRRATDGNGNVFFSQATELMKVKSGYKLFEELLEKVGDQTEEAVNLGDILEGQQSLAESSLSECVDEEGEPLFEISLPSVSFPSIDVLREAVFGSEAGLSQKSVDLSERIGKRELSQGVGKQEGSGFTDMQLFHSYIFNHCNFYGAKASDVWKECLEYQIEYIVSGKGSDLENLENVMWRIFLLRASGNYLFFHQDTKRMAAAEAEAAAMAGITGNAVLVKAVRELLLIGQAIEEGIAETRRVFAGEKVPLYQAGAFSRFEFGYEEYLYLFLNTTNQTDKICRCMDIVELEVRRKCGYENLRLDHCVDAFELQWSYRFDSLFLSIPFMDGGVYENTITRKIYYEK